MSGLLFSDGTGRISNDVIELAPYKGKVKYISENFKKTLMEHQKTLMEYQQTLIEHRNTCRRDVAMQSQPVSPPPMMMTSLSLASNGLIVLPICFFCQDSRKAIAKWMPFNCRPGIGRSLGQVAPVQSTTASNSSCSSWRNYGLFSISAVVSHLQICQK